MPISITIPTLGKPKNVKDAVIAVLTNEWPLSAKKIYNRIRNMGLNVSYQAVHKALCELLQSQILVKMGGGYELNMEWLNEIKKFIEFAGTSYEKNKSYQLSENSFNFDNHHDYLLFLVKFLTEVSKYYNEMGVAHLKHLNWPFTTSQIEYEMLKKMFKSYKKIYLLCKSSGYSDKIISKFYNKITDNISVKFGVNCAVDCETYVCGDFIIQIYYEDRTEKIINQAYKDLKGSMPSAFDKFLGDLFKKTAQNKVCLFQKS